MIAAEVDEIDIYDADLTLKGLKIIYDKNKKSKPADAPFGLGE